MYKGIESVLRRQKFWQTLLQMHEILNWT